MCTAESLAPRGPDGDTSRHTRPRENVFFSPLAVGSSPTSGTSKPASDAGFRGYYSVGGERGARISRATGRPGDRATWANRALMLPTARTGSGLSRVQFPRGSVQGPRGFGRHSGKPGLSLPCSPGRVGSDPGRFLHTLHPRSARQKERRPPGAGSTLRRRSATQETRKSFRKRWPEDRNNKEGAGDEWNLTGALEGWFFFR